MNRDWKYYLTFANTFKSNDVTDALREKWINALLFLKKELGENFLTDCEIAHPLFHLINNTSHGGSWAIDRLINIGDTMQKLRKTTASYPKLLGKLLLLEQCRAEGMPFLEIAEMYLNIGLNVNFVDENKAFRTPDIEIYSPITNDKFYIEVSRLNDKQSVKESDVSYNLFRKHFPPIYDMAYSCYQARNFYGDTIPDVIKKVQLARERSLKENRPFYYVDENIELAIAPYSQRAELDTFCMQYNMRLGMHGMPLNFNETRRVSSRKLPNKCKQIFADYSGIIYIPVNQIYLRILDLDEAVASFQKELSSYPNIIGVVLYGDMIEPSNSRIVVNDDYIFAYKMLNEALLRKILFVKNSQYNAFLNEETILAINSTFDIIKPAIHF